MESIHAVWLDDNGSCLNSDSKNDNPDCEECLERFPLYVLADTDLE